MTTHTITTIRYISRKLNSIYKKLVKKEPKKTDNGVNNVEKPQNKSIDELKRITKLRRIKNRDNNTNDDTYDDTYDDSYDSKIRDKISDIRILLSRLGNIVTKKDKKEIKKEIYEIEKKQNLSDTEKKRDL